MARVLRQFVVGSSDGIDYLPPALLRDLTSNSTAKDGQHLIRSLTALVNRLFNANVSDHAGKLLLSERFTTLRIKDGGIRSNAVGDVFRCLASKVDCAAVTPS